MVCGHFISAAATTAARSFKRARAAVAARPQPSCSVCRARPLATPSRTATTEPRKRECKLETSAAAKARHVTTVVRAADGIPQNPEHGIFGAAAASATIAAGAFHPPAVQLTIWPNRAKQAAAAPPPHRAAAAALPAQPLAPLDAAAPASSAASREAAACLEATRTFDELANVANAHRVKFLKSNLRPQGLSDNYFPQAISLVLDPPSSTSVPAEMGDFDWSGMPPLPPADGSDFHEIRAHALGPGPQLKYGAVGLLRHADNAKSGRVDCAKGLKTARASRTQTENDRAEAQVRCLRQATTVRQYLEVIKARTLQVQGGARRASSMLQQAFYFNVWGQHCSNLSRSPFRWIWALGSRMSPEQRAAEEGLIITFLAYASIRWQSFGVISQCMSHVFTYHERYMLVPRLEKSIGILGVWMRDFESRMVSEEISCHGRDALMPAQLGELISREMAHLQLPTLAAFVAHPREKFNLVPRDAGDQAASRYCFQDRAPGANPTLLPRNVLHSVTCAAAMATCSKGCYRGGNLAVGDDFQPTAPGGGSWTRQQSIAIAGMVISKERIAIHKPRTKTSLSKSAKARSRARLPQAFEHAPEDPLDLPTLFYIMCWLDPIDQAKWQSTPAFRGVKATSEISISAAELNTWLQSTATKHHPALAKLLHLTQYSARIGMATVLALVATPDELDQFGAWASKIGRSVYARMTAERSLQIQRQSMKVQDVTLESLVGSVQAARSNNEIVNLPSAAGKLPTSSAIQPLFAPVPPAIDIEMYDEWTAGATPEAVVQEDIAPPAQVRAEAARLAELHAAAAGSPSQGRGRGRGRPPTPGTDAHFRGLNPQKNTIFDYLG